MDLVILKMATTAEMRFSVLIFVFGFVEWFLYKEKIACTYVLRFSARIYSYIILYFYLPIHIHFSKLAINLPLLGVQKDNY